MKNLFVLIAILFFSINYSAYSQDIILLKTGEEIKALVSEIDKDIIKYKKFENPSSPIYSLKKTDVFMITFENGIKEIFNKQPEKQIQQVMEDEKKDQLILQRYKVLNSNGVVLKKDKLSTIMSKDAFDLYLTGKRRINTGIVFECFSFGIGLYSFVLLHENNASYQTLKSLGIMFLFYMPSAVIGSSGARKIKESVNLYNSGLNKPTTYKINFGINQNGLALVVSF